MNEKRFQLEILTPEKKVFDNKVDYVSAPGVEGEFGVLAGHTDMVSLLKPGEVSIDTGSQKLSFVVSWGYAYVDETSVSILVENAEKAEDIDLDRAVKDKEKWEVELAGVGPDDEQKAQKFRMKIERAAARIALASRFVEQK
jgi:F-type H+-transporting ATPase subunit epsilon